MVVILPMLNTKNSGRINTFDFATFGNSIVKSKAKAMYLVPMGKQNC